MKNIRIIIILFMTSLSCEYQTNLFNDVTTKIDGVSPVITSHNLPILNSAPNIFHINLRFSEGLNPASVNTDSVVVKNNFGNKINNISISYDSTYNEINITGVTDSNFLARGSTYTVTLTKDITDIAGNNLEDEFTGTISIATSPQIPGNGSISTSNYNNGYFVEPGDSIYITFNENIATGLSSAVILSKTTFTPSPSFSGITVTISGNQLIYTIGDVGTNADTYCTINLSAGDFYSAVDGTACQVQNITFSTILKAVKP
ncbi:MAG TPA: Ig-like domain-containing protein [Spirochaetota bacterium]|nr:Ig-like domain-containing protein [Spirochaetota bacterium]HQO22633.1 Ig-like domain-containing protein [Spirochaetota bacterium]HQQ23791.1 Ig-like domain-containing protein [Spirochaetota bacterium]